MQGSKLSIQVNSLAQLMGSGTSFTSGVSSEMQLLTFNSLPLSPPKMPTPGMICFWPITNWQNKVTSTSQQCTKHWTKPGKRVGAGRGWMKTSRKWKKCLQSLNDHAGHESSPVALHNFG